MRPTRRKQPWGRRGRGGGGGGWVCFGCVRGRGGGGRWCSSSPEREDPVFSHATWQRERNNRTRPATQSQERLSHNRLKKVNLSLQVIKTRGYIFAFCLKTVGTNPPVSSVEGGTYVHCTPLKVRCSFSFFFGGGEGIFVFFFFLSMNTEMEKLRTQHAAAWSPKIYPSSILKNQVKKTKKRGRWTRTGFHGGLPRPTAPWWRRANLQAK